MHRCHRVRRRGAHLVECAIITFVTLLLMVGLVVCAMGVFRYQQMAYLAREAARYAATHGGQYQKDNATTIKAGTLPDVTCSYLTTNIVQAKAVSLDKSSLSVAVQINTTSGSYDWDDTTNNGQRWPYSQTTVSDTTYSVTNTVSVTVSYQWTPEWFLCGPITLSSTAVMPLCY